MVVEAPSDLPPIPADLDKLSRMLFNLVDNAIKFTPDEGRIRLWAKQETNGDEPNVLVGVSDTGPGIPASEFDKLFKMFHHDFAGKGRRRGTGLGLPFCKLVAEAHKGQIWAESAGVPGEGSVFIIRLPLAREEQV
ncbi:MAG: sensor histidine kinase [Anaerolineae bacterium]